jgi:2-polyprenyl-3-methyl-5-hydroxy-6-metoxy-1,4-benzoquinol methylase
MLCWKPTTAYLLAIHPEHSSRDLIMESLLPIPSVVTTPRRTELALPAWTCPGHRLPLVNTTIALECPQRHSYPIVAGIPRFVPQSSYAEAFGLQWKRYRLTQLDSHTGTTITRERLRRCLGDQLWEELRDKQVLEAGCGAGRFTEHLLDRGGVVTSIDLTDAVEANRDSFPISARHRVAQADIFGLPFHPQQFDVVLCLGVLQHTPDPACAIAALWEYVSPGGLLVIDHYTFEWNWVTKTSPLVREVLKRLPRDQGLAATEKLVKLMFPAHRWLSQAPRPFRWLRPVFTRISPVQTYYHHYPQLSEASQFEWSLLDTHDQLTDWYKHRYSLSKVRSILESVGASIVEVWKGGNGIEARARR